MIALTCAAGSRSASRIVALPCRQSEYDHFVEAYGPPARPAEPAPYLQICTTPGQRDAAGAARIAHLHESYERELAFFTGVVAGREKPPSLTSRGAGAHAGRCRTWRTRAAKCGSRRTRRRRDAVEPTRGAGAIAAWWWGPRGGTPVRARLSSARPPAARLVGLWPFLAFLDRDEESIGGRVRGRLPVRPRPLRRALYGSPA